MNLSDIRKVVRNYLAESGAISTLPQKTLEMLWSGNPEILIPPEPLKKMKAEAELLLRDLKKSRAGR
jgi:hypothetical protein